jgi:hypothetical protein
VFVQLSNSTLVAKGIANKADFEVDQIHHFFARSASMSSIA